MPLFLSLKQISYWSQGFFHTYLFIHYVFVLCACWWGVPWGGCGSQRAACRNGFSPLPRFGFQGLSSDCKSVAASVLPDEAPCGPVTIFNEGNPGDSEVLSNFGHKAKITHLLCLVIIGFCLVLFVLPLVFETKSHTVVQVGLELPM